MALHEEAAGKSYEWYTPPYVFEALGCTFDIDVASPGASVVPWIPATQHITADSLTIDWPIGAFVWMNAPFGPRNGLVPWLRKFIRHGNGIALVPDRTSCPWWQQIFAPQMDAIVFVTPKIKFIAGADGQPGNSPAQGHCLGGMGIRAVTALHRAEDFGLGIVLVRPVRP